MSLKKITLSIILTVEVIFGFIAITESQVNHDSNKLLQEKIKFENAKGNNEIDYKLIGDLKIASRKNVYRIGELISIDIAMLNRSKQAIYFLDISKWSQIFVHDLDGNKIKSGNYIHPLVAPTFNLIGSREYDSAHLIYLIGCDNARKKYNYSYKSMEDDFDNNQFIYIGGGCIEIDKPGKYLVNAEISNTDNYGKKKTAIGTIKSKSIEITVVE